MRWWTIQRKTKVASMFWAQYWKKMGDLKKKALGTIHQTEPTSSSNPYASHRGGLNQNMIALNQYISIT